MDFNVQMVLSALFFYLVQAFEEVPKFDQLLLLYPGYYLHGGKFRDQDVLDLIGGNQTTRISHNTASLRLSIALNRYGGRHSIGTEPILLSKKGRDSITGRDGVEYIFKNTAFGPYLASRYGNPDFVKVDREQRGGEVMGRFRDRQGIVRLVNVNHRHSGGHVGLWDCDHFVASRDWSEVEELIGVEFWESPDSYCPPPQPSQPTPEMAAIDMSQVHVVVRHNGLVPKHNVHKHRRHRHHRTETVQEELWMQ